jgi:outer membrane protein assembly factor BamB
MRKSSKLWCLAARRSWQPGFTSRLLFGKCWLIFAVILFCDLVVNDWLGESFTLSPARGASPFCASMNAWEPVEQEAARNEANNEAPILANPRVMIAVPEGQLRFRNRIVLQADRLGGVGSERPNRSQEITGAVLKTDPDLEASLETAERFRNDGNYRVATQIWQALLQRSGDALFTTDGETYFSLSQQVEKVIGELPEEGLTTYRITADAEARELLAQAGDPNDVAALSKIVQLYFHSSLGDEAAFKLGCIYLDRFDFIGARRMFEKVLFHYPQPKIGRDQLLLRLAVCQLFLGQKEAAKKLVDEAESLAGSTSQVAMVRQNLGGMEPTRDTHLAHLTAASWRNFLGNERRTGTMPAPPPEVMATDLVAAWQFYNSPTERYNAIDAQGRVVQGREMAQRTVNPIEDGLISSWRKNRWRPAGNLVFDQNRVYFKAAADMIAWDIDKIVSSTEPDAGDGKNLNQLVSWRSVWRNAFEIDEATAMSQVIRRGWAGVNARGGASKSTIPETVPEIQFFTDQIYQQISICNGILYSIEGARYDQDRVNSDMRRQAVQYNTSYRRSRSNFLTAYDAKNGFVQWSLPRTAATPSRREAAPNELTEKNSSYLESGGFMAAPIPFGEWIIVPVNQGGAISIYALDPKQEGKTVWSSFLCDEPDSGAEPCSPIQLSIEGSDLFVSTGLGVVFVLEPATGVVRFAKRYQRSGRVDDFSRRSGWAVTRLIFNGWSNDIVIPYGRQMICFASDSDSIFALDRNSGDVIWHTQMNPMGYAVDYLLGIHNDVLYAGGRETVIAYDLLGEGRMIWGADQMFDGKVSAGRGVLTPEGLFIPVDRSIYHFSLASETDSAKLVKRVGVDLGTGATVGNLYSDGLRFWVHGGNRLYMLRNEE